MRIFRPIHFISDEADDLEEAILIALRKSRDEPRKKWWDCAPRGWNLRYAPPTLVRQVHQSLSAIDRMRLDDEARCERVISLLLDMMRSDVWRAALLIEQIEAEYEEGTIPRHAVARYRKECRA